MAHDFITELCPTCNGYGCVDARPGGRRALGCSETVCRLHNPQRYERHRQPPRVLSMTPSAVRSREERVASGGLPAAPLPEFFGERWVSRRFPAKCYVCQDCEGIGNVGTPIPPRALVMTGYAVAKRREVAARKARLAAGENVAGQRHPNIVSP